MASIAFSQQATLRPANTNEAELFQAATGHDYVCSIWICNQTGAGVAYRIGRTAAGAAVANSEWIVYDATIPADGIPHNFTGIELSAGQSIRIKVDTADAVSFSLGAADRTL